MLASSAAVRIKNETLFSFCCNCRATLPIKFIPVKKSLGHLVGGDATARFTMMEKLRHQYGADALSEALEVSESGFAAHRDKQNGERWNKTSAFRKLTLQLGWVANGRRPRLHDLRHTFACRVLLKWRFRRAGQEDRIDWLSRYLGHERVSDTYWYLSATPQLFAATAKRFKYPSQQ
jgi:integrase